MAPTVHFAGGGPAGTSVTWTGTPVSTLTAIRLKCNLGGVVGVATFQVYVNGTFLGVITSSTTPQALTGTGVSVAFAAGTYTTLDVYSSVPTVASWTSLDGSATVFSQATQADQPAYIAAGGSPEVGWPSGPNGQATLLFNGTSTYLRNSGYAAVAAPLLLAIQTRQITLAGGQLIVADSADAAYLGAGGGVWSMTAGGATQTFGTNATMPNWVSVILNGSNSSLPAARGAPCTLNGGLTGGLTIGAAGPGSVDWYNGDVAEVVLLATNPSTTQIAGLNQYASQRYGYG